MTVLIHMKRKEFIDPEMLAGSTGVDFGGTALVTPVAAVQVFLGYLGEAGWAATDDFPGADRKPDVLRLIGFTDVTERYRARFDVLCPIAEGEGLEIE